MRRTAAFFFLLFLCAISNAQEKAVLPLDLPLSFAGTYGELRHDHFHSGFDWRVGGRIGDPIHAIKSGFVSRISVSTTGYGNGLYITHFDGTTSVYGHMSAYCDKIAKIVKSEQYDKESFSVSIYPKAGEIPVVQGEVIGYVGSTGSSVAPHLHLEVRDTESETPLNYIARDYYKVNDDVSPVFRKINFYAYTDTLPIPIHGLIKSIVSPVQSSETIYLPNKSYIGIDAIDRQNGTPARLAVEEYRVCMDQEVIFDFKVGEIPFSEDRYIQSLIDYSQSYKGGGDVVKTLVDPGNLLALHRVNSLHDGVIILSDYDPHTLTVEVSDIDGNSASLKYTVRRDDSAGADLLRSPASDSTTEMLWFTPNVFINDEISFVLPPAALYNSIYFNYSKIRESDTAANIWSSVWQMGSRAVPLQTSAFIKIRCNIPDRLRDKAVAARYSDGRLSFAGGKWDGSGVAFKGSFGTYCVSVDTIAPQISFLERKGSIVRGDGEIIVPLKDDLSGIGKTDVRIDGKWALYQYRNGRIFITLDMDKVKKGKHAIVVTVSDNCGNESSATRNFIWK
ncbi:MAG: M23 family metallopeptidase [Bacteroidales bacterium]